MRSQLGQDDIAALVADFGIQEVPTLIAIKNREVVDKLIGFYDKDVVTSLIRKFREKHVTENMNATSEVTLLDIDKEMDDIVNSIEATSQERQSAVNLLTSLIHKFG